MAEKLRVGIAGYGIVGKRRRHYIDLHPSMRVTAVCDQIFPNEGGFDDGVKFFPSYERLLNEKLDALFVSLPNYLAAEVTTAGLKRGMHVFCEKPPGRDLNDIASVIRAEREARNLKVMYGFNHRYHDSVQEALRLLQSGEMGKLLNVRGVYGKSKMINFDTDWRTERHLSGGGILLDQGIHMVDLVRLFVGDFSEIHSFVSNEYWKHDVEDNAYAMMKTKEGVVALLHSSATQWRHSFRIELALERGGINLSGILSGSKSYGQEQITVILPTDRDGGNPREITTSYNHDHSWEDEIKEFARCVLENKPVLFGSSTDAYKTMELVYRIYCADPIWKQKYGLSAETDLKGTL